MKKLLTIIMLLCSTGFAHAEFTDIVKAYKMLERANVSLSACAVVAVEFDSLLGAKYFNPSYVPLTAEELAAVLLTADDDYGEGAGHRECGSGLDSTMERIEEDLIMDATTDIETCTLHLYDLDRATSQQDDRYEVDMWELQDYFKSIDAEEGHNAGLKVCLQNVKQALDYMWEKAYDDYREGGKELPTQNEAGVWSCPYYSCTLD